MSIRTVGTRRNLILGGAGKTGRRIAERLARRDAPVRLGSRSAETPFDWNDRGTWAGALAGADVVYLAYQPDLAVPGALETVTELTDLARSTGVQRIVLLSGRGEPEAESAERVVQDSGLEWTIVRCAWFNQNFSEYYLLEPILHGEVPLPVGDVPEPFVDADDIADVASVAMLEDGHQGQLYELTGPRLLTFAEAINEIAHVTRREIRFVPTTVDQYSAMLREVEVPAEIVSLLEYLFTSVLDGRNAHITDGVQRAIGREPRDFSDFARETARTGVWNPQA